MSPKERHHQLVLSLTAITESLNDQGSLLILDIQRATDQTGPNVMGLINGYKTCGYHSSDVVKALEALAMDEIEVVDNKRFQWVRDSELSFVPLLSALRDPSLGVQFEACAGGELLTVDVANRQLLRKKARSGSLLKPTRSSSCSRQREGKDTMRFGGNDNATRNGVDAW